MSGGWIKLHRSIQDHWIWDNPLYLKWWLDLLMLANHKPNEVLVNGKVETIGVGERLTSEMRLSERWNANRKQVRKFLQLLEKNGMISLEKSRQRGTTYKVLKYKDYQQVSDTQRNIDRDINRDNDGDINRDINKNDKNDKNDKNNKNILVSTRKKRVYDDDDPNMKLAKLLLKKIKENQNIKEPDLCNWADSIRKTIQLDKREGKEVQDMILWATSDEFWSGVILSAAGLRRNYDKVAAAKKRAETKFTGVDSETFEEVETEW